MDPLTSYTVGVLDRLTSLAVTLICKCLGRQVNERRDSDEPEEIDEDDGRYSVYLV